MTVAIAAPATPHKSPLIKKISRTIFMTAEMPKNKSGTTELPTERSRFPTKLYKNTARTPAKIHIRYSRISGATSSGTRRKIRMPSIPAYTITFRTSATPPIATKAIKIPFSSLSWFLLPNCMEKKALLPMHNPMIIDVINTIKVYAEPTAANAFSPRYLPTMSVSTILYSC